MRDYPLEHSPPESAGIGHLMTGILGVDRQGEASNGQQPIAALRRRRRQDRPAEHPLGAHERFAVGLGVGDEVAQQQVLSAELEAEGAVELDVAAQIITQHHTAPGQGCAIWRRVTTSTFA